MTHRTVAVVVPVRDDERLRECVGRLRHQTYRGLTEIVIADNGSRRDVWDDLPDDPRIQVVHHPEGGSYSARNAAVAASSSDVVAFTDADCLPGPDWLSEAVRALGDGADVVAGRVDVVPPGGRLHPVVANELLHAFPQETYVRRSGGCITANMVTTRAVLESVGPFRGELASGADIEWSQRAARLGRRVHYVADAVVEHPARTSFAEQRQKIERVVKGRWERDVLEGRAASSSRFRLRMLCPPLGAMGRARKDARTRHGVGPLVLLVGETHARYAAAWAYLRLLPEQRRTSRRTPGA